MNILSFVFPSTGYEIDKERCRASIPSTGGNLWRCSNRAKTGISGYVFCTQHAKIIKAKIKQED
ncbi:MAG TPA: hypothetical protein ENH82_13140 [bacterium]|nr:hypothetical protein [bacterium]